VKITTRLAHHLALYSFNRPSLAQNPFASSPDAVPPLDPLEQHDAPLVDGDANTTLERVKNKSAPTNASPTDAVPPSEQHDLLAEKSPEAAQPANAGPVNAPVLGAIVTLESGGVVAEATLEVKQRVDAAPADVVDVPVPDNANGGIKDIAEAMGAMGAPVHDNANGGVFDAAVNKAVELLAWFLVFALDKTFRFFVHVIAYLFQFGRQQVPLEAAGRFFVNGVVTVLEFGHHVYLEATRPRVDNGEGPYANDAAMAEHNYEDAVSMVEEHDGDGDDDAMVEEHNEFLDANDDPITPQTAQKFLTAASENPDHQRMLQDLRGMFPRQEEEEN